jgi:hypothetical protein
MVGEAGRNKLVKSLLHIWPQWLAGLKPFVSICSHAPRITNHLGDQCFKRMMRNRLRRQPMLRRSDHRSLDAFAVQPGQLRFRPAPARPADWPCRRSPSSPGRRTSRQPSGLGLGLLHLVLGLAAMTSSTAFSMAPVSVTCFMPRSSTISAGSPPSSRRSRTGPWRSCRKWCRLDQIDDGAELLGRNRSLGNAFAGFVQAPSRSLITQLAAILPSRPWQLPRR